MLSHEYIYIIYDEKHINVVTFQAQKNYRPK